MPFRFQRRIRLAPGHRLTLGTEGMSLPVHGVGDETLTHVRVAVGRKAEVEIRSPEGDELRLADERAILRRRSNEIRAWLERECTRWDRGVEEILSLHQRTPPPRPHAAFQPRPFNEPPPAPPRLDRPSLLDRLTGRPDRSADVNLVRQMEFEEAMDAWEGRLAEHERSEEARGARFAEAQEGDPEAVEDFLCLHLPTIPWPFETHVALEVHDRTVWLDILVPEPEDLPTEAAGVADDRLQVLIRPIGEMQRRRAYLRYVHAAIFRLVGEIFHQLPGVERAVASAFCRIEEESGETRDDCLITVSIARDAWADVNFGSLGAIHLPSSFNRFEGRRDLSQTGSFRSVEPLAPEPVEEAEAPEEESAPV